MSTRSNGRTPAEAPRRALKVFVSYAHADQAEVKRLVEEFVKDQDAAGYHFNTDLWFDAHPERGLDPGDFTKRLLAEITSSDYMITVISRNIFEPSGIIRDWLLREAHWAEALEADGFRPRPFQSFVIRLDDTSAPAEWKHKRCIPFATHDWGQSLRLLREYLANGAKLDAHFIDREDVLKMCVRAQNDQDRGRVIFAHNFRGQPEMGGTWLLKKLKWKLEDPVVRQTLGGPLHHVLYFDFAGPLRSYGARADWLRPWTELLKETVKELAMPHLFSDFFKLIATGNTSVVESSRQSPGANYSRGIAPMHTGTAENIAIDVGDAVPFSSHFGDSISEGNQRQTSIDSAENLSETIMQAFIAGLQRSNHRVLWLLDWPPNIPSANPTRQWLCSQLCRIHTDPNSSVRVIVASRVNPLPRNSRRGIPYFTLGHFESDDIYQYVLKRLPTRDDYFRWDIARQVLKRSNNGAPYMLMRTFDEILDEMRR